MLKDFLKKNTTKKEADKVGSVLDGYVDIKIYDCKNKDNKKLVYHDTGDNTVTIWMKHVILQLLAGKSSFSKGKNLYSNENGSTGSGGSCLSSSENEGQLFSGGKEYTIGDINNFSLLPTKVLLGTGKEYTNWISLKNENEEKNAKWYQNMLAIYGDDGKAFTDEVDSECNNYSASISTQGHYSLTSTSIPGGVANSISVEDPDGNKLNTMPSDLSRRIGVVGAIKTPHSKNSETITLSDLESNFLNQAVSDSGRLLQPKHRGVGEPCFLYFKRNKDETDASGNKTIKKDEINSIYDSTSSVYVNRESLSDVVCNKITFTVILPAQTTNSEYYPYNGYTLKQIGLFNDAIMSDSDSPSSESLISKIGKNLMPHGTLLAVKDIAPFTKTSTSEVRLTWTLTI